MSVTEKPPVVEPRPSYRDIPGCENLTVVPGDPATVMARRASFLARTIRVLARLAEEEAAHAAD